MDEETSQSQGWKKHWDFFQDIAESEPVECVVFFGGMRENKRQTLDRNYERKLMMQ